jgi:hypothetical protein
LVAVPLTPAALIAAANEVAGRVPDAAISG